MPSSETAGPPPLPVLDELDGPKASTRTLLVILALGIGFDLAFNGQRPGISIPVFVLCLVAALHTVARRSLETDALLGGAFLLSIFPALRASEPLTALNVLAIIGLVGLAVTQDHGPVSSISIVGLIKRGAAIFTRSLLVPRFVLRPTTTRTTRGRILAVIRVVIIAVPVLAIFASLLASGDRVFARLLSSVLPKWNVESLVSHAVLVIVGAVLVSILWRVAIGDANDEVEARAELRPPLLGSAEWLTVLVGIDLLFATFVLVQLRYLFGGDARVVVTPGLTYAEYARSGFLQMAVAAALTILVILAVWDAGVRTTRDHDRWFRILVTTMVGLSAVVLVSAVKRLALYEGTFGFTIDRFFGYIAMVSIGAALVVLTLAIWANRRDRVVAGFLLIAFAALLTVNVMNPDRFVAERNIARFEATGKIDTSYLVFELGPDSVPVVADLLDDLPPTEADALRVGLCDWIDRLGSEPSWRSVNLGRSSARTALAAAGITPASCGVAVPTS